MEKIRRDALGSDAAQQIRDAILEGRLTPGSRIDQDELAAQLGVSRLPIRQALTALSREGLVSIEHRRGAAVTPVDTRFIRDLYDFRAAVDAQVAATLARRRDFDPREMRAMVAEGQAAAQRGEVRPDLSLRFHTAQYEATGNRVLIETMAPLLWHVRRVITLLDGAKASTAQFDRSIEREQRPIRSQTDMWKEHSDIVEAIAAHRVGRARSLARDHARRVRGVITLFLDSVVAKAGPSAKSGDRAI